MEILEPVSYSDSDLRDIWDHESFESVESTIFTYLNQKNLAEEMHLDSDADWAQILDHQPIVLNDRMMTDAVQSPHIQSEHSYSLTLNDELPQSPFGHNIKLEDYDKDSVLNFLKILHPKEEPSFVHKLFEYINDNIR